MIEVLTRNICPTCDGAGQIESPEWIRWYEEEEEAKRLAVPIYLPRKDGPLGPEEIICFACKGGSYIETWIPVIELAALFDALRLSLEEQETAEIAHVL